MSTLKRYTGSSLTDISQIKRYNGTSFVDVSSAKRWDGTSWIDVYPNKIPVDLYVYNTNKITSAPSVYENNIYIDSISDMYKMWDFYFSLTDNKSIKGVYIPMNEMNISEYGVPRMHEPEVYVSFIYTDGTNDRKIINYDNKYAYPNTWKTLVHVELITDDSYDYDDEIMESWDTEIQILINSNYTPKNIYMNTPINSDVQMHVYDRVGLIGDGPVDNSHGKYMSLQYDTNGFYAPASLSGKISFTNNEAIEYVYISKNKVTVNDIDYFANVYVDIFYADNTSTRTFAYHGQEIYPSSSKIIDYIYVHSAEFSESTDWTFDIQIQLNPGYIVTDIINEL